MRYTIHDNYQRREVYSFRKKDYWTFTPNKGGKNIIKRVNRKVSSYLNTVRESNRMTNVVTSLMYTTSHTHFYTRVPVVDDYVRLLSRSHASREKGLRKINNHCQKHVLSNLGVNRSTEKRKDLWRHWNEINDCDDTLKKVGGT